MSIVRVPFSLTGGGAAAYVPAGAIWLDGSADYLTWTPSGAGASTTDGIFSCWVKLSKVDYSSTPALLRAGSMAGTYNYLHMTTAERWAIEKFTNPSTTGMYRQSDGIYRDPTAWAHICMSLSTSDGTADDRFHLYVNGVREDGNSVTTPSSGEAIIFASAVAHYIGLGNGYFDGYLADVVYLDGKSIQAGDYAITDFVDTDDNGNPIPVDPSGLTFGTNGFWLDFADSADLGNDVSGNGNDFTPTSMSPANSTSDRPADDVENDLGNYNTVSTLFTREVNSYSSPAGSITTSNGNLTVDFQNGGANPLCITTQVLQPGKKYHFEWTTDVWGSDALTYVAVWLFPEKALKNTTDINAVGVYHYNIYTWNPSRGIGSSTNFNGSSLTSISASDAWGVGEVLSLDIDMSTVGSTTVVAKLDGVTLATDSSLAFLDEPYVICPQVQSNAANRTWKGTFNFGASAFATTPLTDHVGVYTSILPAPTITDPSAYFKALLWTGDSSSPRSITGFTDGAGNNVTPDLVWLKGRTGAGGPYSYHLYDVVRGFGSAYSLRVDDTSVEGASGTANGYLDSVIAGGFSVTGGSSDDGYVNENGWTYVAWCLKAGGAGSANTDGDISSTVSVADHSGFSIVTWTGDGSNDNRVGHGMGQTPQIVIYKRLSSVSDWYVTTTVIDGSFDVVFLNTTAAKSDIPGTYTAPTSTTITNYGWGVGQDMVAYCFARVPGLIGIGSYKGNGSADGPYVVVDDGGSGFRPAFLLIKNINDVRDWQIYDNRRPGYNVNDIDAKTLQIPTLTETNRAVDFTANGFKPRTTAQEVNNNGNTFIYLAFAEYPFGGDGVAQAKAR